MLGAYSSDYDNGTLEVSFKITDAPAFEEYKSVNLDVKSISYSTDNVNWAERSIVVKGNGEYSLKPVVRAYITANTSSVSGYLLPNTDTFRVFTISSNNDTISTIADIQNKNYFLMQGLFSGVYTLKVQNMGTGAVITLDEEMDINGGTNLDLGTITINQQ